MKDTLLTVVKALPAAAASATTDTLDLGPNGGKNQTGVELLISFPALPALVDTKKVTVTVRDSADDSTFADVVGYGNLILTGAGGAGVAATDFPLRLHDHVRQYVRIKVDVETGGGDNTAKSVTCAIVWPS